ncbi:MAG: helix-turn-helix domain-containing protein [Pseudomonadota bacterium]
MPKKARLSGIKAFRCYTIDEAAEITGVSPRGIRNWSKNGLRLMDTARPVLIRGDDLHAYIQAQRDARKVKTAPDEFYCCRCAAARKAAGGVADCTIVGKRVTLTALCITCETVMSKPISEARMPEIARTLDIKITRHEMTL